MHKRRTWEGEYVFSGRDNYKIECWCVGLKDLIEEIFNEKIFTISKF